MRRWSRTTARANCCSGSRWRCARPARTRCIRSVDELAGVDEFHARGREATVELADWLPPALDTELLDIGSGIGGPARFLAATRGYRVVGVDLTPEYVAVANELSRRCGLDDRVRFLTADALNLPFEPASFAAAYTQHVAMNIADKQGLYAEVARVLRPGGSLVIYDILQGPGGAGPLPDTLVARRLDQFPVGPREPAHEHLTAAGFEVLEHRERAKRASLGSRPEPPPPPPGGRHR